MSDHKCDGYTCRGELHDSGCSLGGMAFYYGREVKMTIDEALAFPSSHENCGAKCNGGHVEAFILAAEVRRLRAERDELRGALEKIASYPEREYGEDDADDLDTLQEAAEAVGRGQSGSIARKALTPAIGGKE